LTTFERRQTLIEILRKQPGLRVPELAQLMTVSPGTVRNDLTALEEDGKVIRVHGGATVVDNVPLLSPSFSIRSRKNYLAKRSIAVQAARLVEDGDSILLDASTTVLQLTHELQNRRNLRVFTNGIEAARAMAKNPTNTVTLLGGALNQEGTSISGLMSEQFLQELHIQTAFVSCSGFSSEAGLTEVHLDEARLKVKMIAAAAQVIALVDSSKFGKVDLTSYARIDQITHLYTDQTLNFDWIARLRLSGLAFSVCSDNHVTTFTPGTREGRHFRIGFANLSDQLPFAIEVSKGIERAARDAGNVDLFMADNRLKPDVALKVAEQFLSQDLDLIIEYQIDAQMGTRIMNLFRERSIPVISIDIPMIGATYFGVDHYQAGLMAGLSLGEWVRDHWDGQFDQVIILEEPRAGAIPASRNQGQLEGFKTIVGDYSQDKRFYLDCGNTSEISERAFLSALKRLPNLHRLVVMCFNDGAVIGALEAARRLRREEDLIIVGQGADRRVLAELFLPGSRIIGSTVFSPEKYGDYIIPLALRILRGEPVPPAVYIETTFIKFDPKNLILN
jgi:ribose transport system substrate-binding protein